MTTISLVNATARCSFSAWLFAGILLFVFATGCGDAQESGASVKGLSVRPQKPFVAAEGFVPAYYLDRATFLSVDDSIINFRDKLVLQVQPQKEENRFSLAVFAIADSSKHLKEEVGKLADTSRMQHPKPFANALDVSGKKLQWISQRTREDEYRKLLTEIRKYPFINYILFVPELEGDHLRFKLTGVEKLPLDMASGFATTSYYSRSF